jgi:acyl-CoA synthetase (AMP-forming)/AMP-acid ligase II/acyl carrier protein
MSTDSLSILQLDAVTGRRRAIFADVLAELARVNAPIDLDAVQLDDTPFHQLGIDSIILIKLVGDLERRFEITIDDTDAVLAFSFERLVALIETKTAVSPSTSGRGSFDVPAFASSIDTQNLLAIMEASSRGPGASAEFRVLSFTHDRADAVYSHHDFLRKSAWLGQQLPEVNGKSPRNVIIVATEQAPTMLAFFAALGVGARPLIIAPPKALGGVQALIERLDALLAVLGDGTLLAVQEGVVPDLDLLPTAPKTVLPSDPEGYGLVDELPAASTRPAHGDDIAFFQLTSASTGDPKVVAITHRNVCANLRALHQSMDMRAEERTFLWLPLYHDMGLVGGVIFPFFHGYTTVMMKPTEFIRSPARWIRGMSEHRTTFGGAPNFGIEYAAQMVSAQDLDGIDLSSVRRFGLAAEPIQQSAVQAFIDRFAPAGFRPEALVPGLGLAEITIAGTTAPGRSPRYLVIDAGGTTVGARVAILGGGSVTYPATPGTHEVPGAPAESDPGVAVFALGPAIPGISLEIQDETGAVLTGEGVIGEVVLSGPSVSPGYLEAATGQLVGIPDGILRTGDLGFIESGDLFLLGRMKNVIIRRGANYMASLLEEQVATILGQSAFGIMVVDADVLDPGSKVHAVVENSAPDADITTEQRAALRALELPVDVLTFAAGFALPRTTSGKKRYHVLRQMIMQGTLSEVRTVRPTARE